MEEKAMRKSRLISLIKRAAPILLLGLAYYVYVRITGYGIPCLIQAVTGAYCPGCGVSRMFVSLIGGNIKAAAGYNLLVLCLLPFGAVYGGYRAYVYVKDGSRPRGRAENIIWIVLFILVVAFWVMRNLPQFAFLAPAPYGV